MDLKNLVSFKKLKKKYDVVILGVAHDIFKKFSNTKIKKLLKKINVIYDLCNFLSKEIITERL